MDDGPEMREPRLRAILRVPLFYKILVANVSIVVTGAVAGTWTAVRLARASPDLPVAVLVALLAGAGAVVSVVVNALILRLALQPLRAIERTVEAVNAGDEAARVPESPVADRDLERLASAVNEMLDSLAVYRRRLRMVAERSIHSAERERQRIARDLHDDTAQRLVSLQLRLRALRETEEQDERKRRLDEVLEHLRSTAEGVRRLARGLRPPALDELGLASAIRGYARSQGEAFAVPIDVRGAGDPTLDQDTALAAYRIVQEAVSNALRHGDPSRVEIRLREEPGQLVVTVADDGSGFDPQDVARRHGAGLGLAGMKERVGYVGGSVTIDTESGRGTRVRISVPAPSGAPNTTTSEAPGSTSSEAPDTTPPEA